MDGPARPTGDATPAEANADAEVAQSGSRTTVDLLDLPLVFSQRLALTPEQFSSATKARGRELRVEQLEALHRTGILVPFYRVDYDARTVVARARRNGHPVDEDTVKHVLGAISQMRHLLDEERAVGDLHDPAFEAPVPWRVEGTFRGERYRRSQFLYSEYQLLGLGELAEIRMRGRWRQGATPRYRVAASPLQVEWATHAASRSRGVATALCAVEARYLPDIVESLSLPFPGGRDEWARYADSFDPAAVLEWLGWTPERLLDEADALLVRGRSIDPTPDLFPLLGLAHPATWKRFHGDGLRAYDHYIAGEMLLRLHDDLAPGGRAPMRQTDDARHRGSRARLKGDRTDLDRLLMRAGLSPHPRLLLVLEGKTERILVPDVLTIVYGPKWRSFAEVLDAGGVDRNLESLAAYAATPRLGEPIAYGVELTRPPIRLVVLTDPEGRRLTPAARERERQAWIQRMYEAVDPESRTDILRGELEHVVEIVAWNDAGQSFEFANFTDRELARAIVRLDRRKPTVSVVAMSATIRALRARAPTVSNPSGTKLSDAWWDWPEPRPTKGALAEALRPILKAKVTADLPRIDEDSVVPVLRIVRTAVRGAHRSPRNALLVIRR